VLGKRVNSFFYERRDGLTWFAYNSWYLSQEIWSESCF